MVGRRADARYCSDSCRALASSANRKRNETKRTVSDNRPAQVATVTAIRPPGPLTWEPPSEPRSAYRTAEPCPACGNPLMAEPRGIWRACGTCGGLVTPPGVTAPYASGSNAPQRQVKSQRERDLEALALAGRKGVMLAQLRALADDDRLHPESLPKVEWFAEQVRAAGTDARLDELAELLAVAGIRRRRWWQGQPAAIEAPVYDDEDQAGGLDYDDEDDEDDEYPARAVLATPASIAAQQHRTQPQPMTWADAIAVSGWRLSPTIGGCQIVEESRLCGAETTNSITGGWLCGRHYYALCQVITNARHGRPA